MKKILFFAAIIVCAITNAQVGVGTTTPNPNSALDITSTNKGVLIPRIGDTTGVPTPTEGLIIYNKHTKSPYFYNGSRWVAMGTLPMSTSIVTDRITYKVTGVGGFSATEEAVFAGTYNITKAVSPGGSGHTIGATHFAEFNFSKATDINSVKITQSTIQGTLLPTVEFKFYATGASTPYISYKFQDVIISSYGVAGAEGGSPITENLSLNYLKFGFKDWVNIREYGWNVATGQPIPY